MNLVDKAKNFATYAHAGQFRKHGNRPYIYHPGKVVEYLQSKGYTDKNLLAAAWLHDTVEDVDGVTYNTIEENFGPVVVELVREVSHPEVQPKWNRSQRWSIYLDHYVLAGEQGRILKLADRIANLTEYQDFWPEVDQKGRQFLERVYLDESNDLYENLIIENKQIRLDLLYIMNELDELLSEEY